MVDSNGNTPMHILVARPRDADGVPIYTRSLVDVKLELMQMLYSNGASLEVPNDDGIRPLHIAIKYGMGYIAAGLMTCGADLEGIDSDGWTPLHLCAAGYGEQPAIALPRSKSENAIIDAKSLYCG